MKKLLALVLVLLFNSAYSQTTPPLGLREKTPNVIAITNATIIVSPEIRLEKATLIIRDGLIEAVGKNIPIPKDAEVMDMKGTFIYPGFIEPFSDYGIPKAAEGSRMGFEGDRPHPTIERIGSLHWNAAVHPEKEAVLLFKPDEKAKEKLRGQGFTVVQTASLDGIFRGSSAVVDLGDGLPNDLILNKDVAQFLSFQKGSSNQDYPSSLMGSIALIRQTLYDAQWYQKAQQSYQLNPAQTKPEQNAALAALDNLISGTGQGVFAVGDELSLLRAARIANEFGLNLIYKASGYEYRRLAPIQALNATLIVPLNFPEAPNVATPEAEADVSLGDLKHWDTAPENPGRLEKAKVRFAFTANGLKEGDNFLEKVREAIKRGLSEKKALAALTTVPAEICGVSDKLGTLEKGKMANFIIASDSIFSDKAKIYTVWIKGKSFEINPKPEVEPRGTWEVTLQPVQPSVPPPLAKFTLEISGKLESPEGKVVAEAETVKVSELSVKENKIQFSLEGDSLKMPGTARFSGRIEKDKASGLGTLGDGSNFKWSSIRTKPYEEKPDTAKKEEKVEMALFETVYPDKAFGRKSLPALVPVAIIKNATIWTCGPQGVLKKADMIVRNGKIEKVGQNLAIPKNAFEIDGSGLHVSPGIIDEHSHIAISAGVNEGAEAVTSEVRIGDVVDCDDIDIYRQLSGGVTSSHLLHGSANPIGGQLQLIKLRWGSLPEEMKFAGADPTIKFALGENVKQSNWGDAFRIRYPQTRMGVEEIIRDEFQAAKEYEKEWKKYNSYSKGKQKSTIPPRKDIELDAIDEVLNSRRFIHCHSYVQSEILMLIRLAEEYGFKVGTFTHILEGYKVAGEISKHGAGASSFSDWWAYKFEVYEATPYNGALLYKQKVVTSFNSDDGEMARRLNQEAGKAVKYGEVPEEEALKFATLNPAKQMHVDRWVGSLEPGKDADFVLWSANPLSNYAKCMQTWIDGRKYFDIAEDLKMRQEVKRQKAALVQKVLKKKDKPGGGDKPMPWKGPKNYDCETVYDFMRGE